MSRPICAIYARKPTEQAVADEQKSIARQVEHARQYATRKGWNVDEAYVFVDDGISGAEFTRRPGFLFLDARAELPVRVRDVLEARGDGLLERPHGGDV